MLATTGLWVLGLVAPSLVDFDVAKRCSVQRLPGFLSLDEIEELRSTAQAVQRIRAGDVLTAVGATRDRQLREGGRTVHINHHLAEMMPALHDRLLRAAREADRDNWRGAADADRPDVGVLDDRAMVALRSAEYHDVRGKAEGALPMHLHGDYGSLVTIDLMLSHSSEYEGGVLQTMEADGNLLDHTFEQGDALIFLSHKEHGVTPVTSGRRQIVVCELWEGLPRRCPQRCDQPWYPCHCKYRPLALYSKPEASSPWPPNGPTDMEKLRRNGLADYRARRAREAREAADRSKALLAARSAIRAPPQTVADAAASAAPAADSTTTPPSPLGTRGFEVLPDPVVDPALLEAAAATSRATLRKRLAQVERAGCDPLGQQYLFKEICHRQRGRWDLQLLDEADEPTVFMPLVDVEADGDGTEFWPTANLAESTRALAKHIMSDAANSPLDPNALEAPACRAGGLIIFDYRTIHRGLANEGERERPIAYFVCATGGATDAHNFPEGGIADATPAEAAAFPFWNAPGQLRAQDDLDYYTEIEGDPFAIPAA